MDILELSQDISMVEMNVMPEWEGKPIAELGLRRKYSINIVAIRQGSEVLTIIDPEMVLDKSMKLIVIINSSSKILKQL